MVLDESLAQRLHYALLVDVEEETQPQAPQVNSQRQVSLVGHVVELEYSQSGRRYHCDESVVGHPDQSH